MTYERMTDEERAVEKLVVELTRAIHPEDLGEPTSELESVLRSGLVRAYKLGATKD